MCLNKLMKYSALVFILSPSILFDMGQYVTHVHLQFEFLNCKKSQEISCSESHEHVPNVDMQVSKLYKQVWV